MAATRRSTRGRSKSREPKLPVSPSSPAASPSPANGKKGPRSAMSGSAVKKDETKMRKILTRTFYGVMMVGGFFAVMYAGHVWVCLLIALVEVLLFRELVKVRYNTHLDTIEEKIPLFRTTQWAWFIVAIYYTYGDFMTEIMKNNRALHPIALTFKTPQMQVLSSFALYAGVFVLTVATLQKEYLRFQMNQLCWTVCILFLTIGQLKYIMHNVFNGLFWFAFPVLLVVINDVMAYVCGMTCGRKFINRPFLKLSPNKTWEGFIGAFFFTVVFGVMLAKFMAGYTWMTCPVDLPTLWSPVLDCEVDNIFVKARHTLPTQLFEILPRQIVRHLPGITEFCSTGDRPEPCVSGNEWDHHHFEIENEVLPIQLHAVPLSIFASLVAPFGGFLASGIKRAYGIKDFDSLIPGHGGVMDRMDCQFLMALCTWVHYNAFVKMATVSVSKLVYFYKLMNDKEQAEFLAIIAEGTS